MVFLHIGDIHPLQIKCQLLARQQSLAEIIPVAETHKVGLLQPQFVSISPFGSLGQIVGELVGLEVDLRCLTEHPVVQLFVGELGSQQLFDRFAIGNLLLVIL